ENIYQRVALKTFVEINFAADGWDSDAISVVRDAGDDASEQAAIGRDLFLSIFGRVGALRRPDAAARRPYPNGTEPPRVPAKFRARAHRENVANDSADAGGCALEWLNRARVIVAFHFERNSPAVP